jgi:Na+/phosphate symporter
MLITIVPVLAVLIGIFLWFAPFNAKIQDLGRILFAVGIFFVIWMLAGEVVHFGKR